MTAENASPLAVPAPQGGNGGGNPGSPGIVAAWLLATRPRTLAAGLVPVAVGTALARPLFDPLRLLACLAGALLIQIGCNFANDAFDALKGADTPDRVGPRRAVAAGLISARAMLIGTAIVLAVAFAIGCWLATVAGWGIFALGIVSLACAVLYTGGPAPLAYLGLGDLFVFLFFGLFAVLGSAWVQRAGHDPQLATADWLVAAAVGLQATAIIAVNNLRDIETDTRANKRTLAVRLGDRATRVYYLCLHLGATGLLAGAALITGKPWHWLPVAAACLGGLALARAVAKTRGAALNKMLAKTAALELLTGLCLVAAYCLG